MPHIRVSTDNITENFITADKQKSTFMVQQFQLWSKVRPKEYCFKYFTNTVLLVSVVICIGGKLHVYKTVLLIELVVALFNKKMSSCSLSGRLFMSICTEVQIFIQNGLVVIIIILTDKVKNEVINI